MASRSGSAQLGRHISLVGRPGIYPQTVRLGRHISVGLGRYISLSSQSGGKEFIAGQLKAKKKFDGKLVAKGGDMATGSTSGTATGTASAVHTISALTKSAEATTSATVPAKSAAAPAQVLILAAAPTIPTDTATAPPRLRKM